MPRVSAHVKESSKDGTSPVSNGNRSHANSLNEDDGEIGEYEPKISSSENYHTYLQLVHSPSLSDEDGNSPTKLTQDTIEEMIWDEHGQMYTESLNSPSFEGDGVPDNIQRIDPAERERMMQEWKDELHKVEEEIVTLRQVLTAKVRESAELKRKLGITPFQEFKHDMQSGINTIKESNTYQKTSAVVKTASEKTSSALSTIGTSVSRKLGDIRNSQTFRSMEERVGSTYANVKAKVAGSKSDEGLDASSSEGTGPQDRRPRPHPRPLAHCPRRKYLCKSLR
ncbi:tumor protein D52-like isoform X2 [Liolophura sinensis]|uniref:tumor protein D52-like isoform X2 n=1 Tax=Liolophura sinensis TaxID=3198878 RepID=UPI00315991B0